MPPLTIFLSHRNEAHPRYDTHKHTLSEPDTMREYLCVAWWAMVLQHGLTQTIEEVHFSRDETCPDQVVSASHCRLAVGGRSTVHCAVLCSGQPWCVYSAWDSNLRLCRLCQVAEDAGCTNTERVALAGYLRVTVGYLSPTFC